MPPGESQGPILRRPYFVPTHRHGFTNHVTAERLPMIEEGLDLKGYLFLIDSVWDFDGLASQLELFLLVI